eukprot:CAMPEP_0182438372 /NCGR_PEP_ID=MMETSP1167-20130531/85718_1 /TAXON_ID=2988 /ORGANISM="Mallomonas Sp, Strain CCMP3275" /LENGTH=71 /DNA_ID=CAMNT_0024631699 /DNA_START=868 /DNA_END=1083 /DNA_ORIENTATION=-
MARMIALGEEWAEEEELPGSERERERERGGEGANMSTGRAAQDGEYNKLAQQASSRVFALKKEKRKSRMYG